MSRRMRATTTIGAGLLALACAASPAIAQVYVGRDTPHAGSWEASGGLVWTQGFDQGVATATETRNPGTGSGRYELFTADTTVGSAPGIQGRLGVYLTRATAIEGGVQYSRPVLSARLGNDAEQADSTTAEETLTRLIVDGSVLFHFTGATFSGGRGVPFVVAGGGYLRELHDGFDVVETGNEFHGGAGLKYWFTQGRQRFGLRAEGGVMSRSGGADFKDGRRILATAGASLAYLF